MKQLRSFTMARVALDRAGDALAMRELLDVRRAHAVARDAVHQALDTASLRLDFESRGWEVVVMQSAARDRTEYLRRPDLGRNPKQIIKGGPFDALIVVADGLSATAIHRHAAEVIARLLPKLREAD